MKCRFCEKEDLSPVEKPNGKFAFYCDHCGKFNKWASRDELLLYVRELKIKAFNEPATSNEYNTLVSKWRYIEEKLGVTEDWAEVPKNSGEPTITVNHDVFEIAETFSKDITCLPKIEDPTVDSIDYSMQHYVNKEVKKTLLRLKNTIKKQNLWGRMDLLDLIDTELGKL